MKKLSKIMSVVLMAVMVVGLFASMSVSAANVFFPLNYGDIVTYSFDITVPEGKILVAQPKAPMNTAAVKEPNWSQGSGCVKIAGGKIQASKSWLDQNSSTIGGANTDFPAGQKNNLMMRKNHRTGYTEFIANGVSFCTTTMDYKTLPVSMLQLFGDGADVSTIETVFIKGTVEGELGVIADCDKDNKKITVRFTEPIDTATDLSTTVLKNANGNKEDTVALTVSQFDGIKAVFAYEGALAPSEEYSVVLPEGLTGQLGGKIRIYPKVTTDATSLYQENNYSAGSTDIWKNDGFNPIDSGEEDHGGVMVFGTYNDSGNYSRDILKLDIPDSNIFTISYDAKVLVDTIKMGWTLWQQAGADGKVSSMSLCYGTTDGTAAGNFMILQADTSNTNAGWISSNESWQTKLGTWKKDQWINHKLEFNRTEKTVKVYVDGVYKATKTIKNSGSCNIIAPGKTGTAGGGTWNFSVVANSGPTTTGTHFMYMDNIKVETIAEPTVVSEVAFVDGRGNKAGAGDTISRLLDKIDVKFSSEIDESTLSTSTVKLYYNSTEVGYTPSYDATTRTYTLEPARLPDANAEVKVVVDEVYTPGDTPVAITPCEAVATADDTESKLFVYEVEAVDETDVRPFSGVLTKNNRTSYYPIMRAANFTDTAQQITLISAEYDVDGNLTSVKIENPITLNSGSYIRYGGKLNGDNVIASNSNTKTIKVFAWDGTNMITPFAEPAIATK